MEKNTEQEIEEKSRYYNVDGRVTSRLVTLWSRSYDNIWSVLSLFFSAREFGLCKVQIDKEMKFGVNTAGTTIKRLLRENLIYLSAQNVGANKCRKYYKITELGKATFREYLRKQQIETLKKHISPSLDDF